jgi:hypothetical protein
MGEGENIPEQFGPVEREYNPMRSWRAWSTFNNDDVEPFHECGQQQAMLNMLPESTTHCHLRPERHWHGTIVDGDERGCPLPTEEAVLPNLRISKGADNSDKLKSIDSACYKAEWVTMTCDSRCEELRQSLSRGGREGRMGRQQLGVEWTWD